MSDPKIIFETPRLIVRRWTEDDAPAAFAIYSDPDVMRFLGTGNQKPIADVEVMRTAIRDRWLKRYLADPNLGMWAAQRKDNGQIVGSILLVPLDGQSEIEVGWHLGKFAWGNGYATEGARGAIEHGFAVANLERIVCVVHPDNHKSIAVTKRLGLTHEGRHRAYGQDLEYFSVVRSSHGR